MKHAPSHLLFLLCFKLAKIIRIHCLFHIKLIFIFKQFKDLIIPIKIKPPLEPSEKEPISPFFQHSKKLLFINTALRENQSFSAVGDTLGTKCPSTIFIIRGSRRQYGHWPYWEAVPRVRTRLTELVSGPFRRRIFSS